MHEARHEKDEAVAVLKKYLQHVNPRNREIRHQLVRIYVDAKDYHGREKRTGRPPCRGSVGSGRAAADGPHPWRQTEYAQAIDRLNGILKVRPAEFGNEGDRVRVHVSGDPDPRVPSVSFVRHDPELSVDPATVRRSGHSEAGQRRLSAWSTGGRAGSRVLDRSAAGIRLATLLLRHVSSRLDAHVAPRTNAAASWTVRSSSRALRSAARSRAGVSPVNRCTSRVACA